MTSIGSDRQSEQERESDAAPEIFMHVMPLDNCEHDFQGWREFEDGRGGERVCAKCGMGAMEHSLRTGF